MSIREEFRDFITKGNLVQIAVAFVLGTAFAAVIAALVTDIIDPIIGFATGGNLSQSGIVHIGPVTFFFGAFLSAVIYFLIVGLILFFVIALPYSRYQARQDAKKAKTTRECPSCLSTVPIKATRCSFCTSTLTPPSASPPAAA